MWFKLVIIEERMLYLKKVIFLDFKYKYLNYLFMKDFEIFSLFSSFNFKIYCSVMRNVNNMYNIEVGKKFQLGKKVGNEFDVIKIKFYYNYL